MQISRIKKILGLLLLLLVLIVGISSFPLRPLDPIQYYDRESGQIETEKVAGEKWLKLLYYNPVGEATLWVFAKRKLLSSIYGNLMDRTSSAKKIKAFIEDFDIDMSIAQEQDFNTFNEFFIRKLKSEARPIDTCNNSVVSPADGKVLAYADISNTDFIVKSYRFNVFSFLENPELAQKYENASLIIIRLAPVDYHRFHFPIKGNVSPNKKIEGDYYSVSPFALRKRAEIFFLNKREYTVISNPEFGNVIMSEVGATMVGSIIQTYKGNSAIKGEEKGYFKFGGSTVVLLFEKNKIQIDEDLLIHTSQGLETTIKMGERIGESVQLTDLD